MTHINTLDPGASPLDYFGFELRRYREAAELTQKQLGDTSCRRCPSVSGWMSRWVRAGRCRGCMSW